MSANLRRYASQTTTRLIIGALLILFTVGPGLIWWLYGPGAALLGLLCLLGALLPVVLIWASLVGLEMLAKRLNKE